MIRNSLHHILFQYMFFPVAIFSLYIAMFRAMFGTLFQVFIY